MIESPDSNGVLYNSVGINGAGYKSILKEILYGDQLRELKPDLIILDLGGNDFGPGKIYIDDMKRDLGKIIDIIRKASPETCIIVTNAQDCFRRRRNMYECLPFSELTKEVAFSKNCAFYNYYNVSGNRYAMLYWYKNRLAQRDRTHLTNAGYYVKGELYLNAILNSYYESLVRTKKDTLLISKIDTSKIHTVSKFTDINNINVVSNNEDTRPNKDSFVKNVAVVIKTPNNYKKQNTETNEKYYYVIKSGDNLGRIAQKFHVTTNQIKQWNNLKSTKIIVGKTLLIYRKKNNSVNNNQTNNNSNNNQNANNNNQNNTNNKKGKITHKVIKGDNLWDISKKYKVPMDQIIKLNNIKNNYIKVGSILIISN
jgi:LysM repeat protein